MKKSLKWFLIGSVVGCSIFFVTGEIRLQPNDPIAKFLDILWFPTLIIFKVIDKIIHVPNQFEQIQLILTGIISLTVWYGLIFLFISKIVAWIKNKKNNKKEAV